MMSHDSRSIVWHWPQPALYRGPDYCRQPRGGKFAEAADRPPRLAFKDYSSQRDNGDKESLTGAAVPLSAGTPRAGDGPAPAYVPERRGRLVDTLRGIGRI